jgi:hypothetical protein
MISYFIVSNYRVRLFTFCIFQINYFLFLWNFVIHPPFPPDSYIYVRSLSSHHVWNLSISSGIYFETPAGLFPVFVWDSCSLCLCSGCLFYICICIYCCFCIQRSLLSRVLCVFSHNGYMFKLWKVWIIIYLFLFRKLSWIYMNLSTVPI